MEGKERKPQYVKCSAWLCNNFIINYKRYRNKSGVAEYCSVDCYRKCSPAMRRVGIDVGVDELSDGLNPYVYFVFKIGGIVLEKGWVKAAKDLGVSRNTIRKWLLEAL